MPQRGVTSGCFFLFLKRGGGGGGVGNKSKEEIIKAMDKHLLHPVHREI